MVLTLDYLYITSHVNIFSRFSLIQLSALLIRVFQTTVNSCNIVLYSNLYIIVQSFNFITI